MELKINFEKLSEIGIVVPTLGEREEFLVECLKSINDAGCRKVILVGPKNRLNNFKSIAGLYTKILEDPKTGLPDAINIGIKEFSEEIKYVGWLGDDDLLTKNSLNASLAVFASKTNVVATYGACSYIDRSGKELFLNKSGFWASKFMVFLPNLIPQPGSIFLRSAYEKVGGVRSSYPLSFDFELFFNLRKLGNLHYIPNTQGCFRWHENSMSVDQRRMAVLQTSEIRKSFLPNPLKKISFLWEPIIVLSTLILGKLPQLKPRIK